MIIKSMSRKTASFAQLLGYIAAEGKVTGTPIVHNLYADGSQVAAVKREFMANAEHCPPRKNGVLLYHEILSISEVDRHHVSAEMLSDLARHYLSLRAPEALAYGAIHFDQNPHVHMVISGNLRQRPEKLRLSRADFAQVKRDLEAYQKQRYPQLIHSLVFAKGRGHEAEPSPLPSSLSPSPSKENLKPTAGEQDRKRRLHRQGRKAPSQKEQIREQLLTALVASPSRPVFAERIGQADMMLYDRGGRLRGVIVRGKKYRFRTLGLDRVLADAQRRWQQVPERQQRLAGIRAEKAREISLSQTLA